mgnify:CR=1 FL=1
MIFKASCYRRQKKEKIIGVRTPILRKFAKEFAQTKEAQNFLQELPHQYYEENNLHLMLCDTDLRLQKMFKRSDTIFTLY